MVFTREEQAALTPDEVLELLREGNERFVSGTLERRIHTQEVRAAAEGQYPMAIVLTCVDSRIPVEDVFDRGIGELFVARIAGNFANRDILGSMEFACKIAGSKLVMVLGHEHCGAIQSAIDGVELGNVTALLANISPAIDRCAAYGGDKASTNDEYVRMVTEAEVRVTLETIRANSPILSAMEDAGEIRIVGGMYGMELGAVQFLDR